jgi:hypothetical protein
MARANLDCEGSDGAAGLNWHTRDMLLLNDRGFVPRTPMLRALVLEGSIERNKALAAMVSFLNTCNHSSSASANACSTDFTV